MLRCAGSPPRLCVCCSARARFALSPPTEAVAGSEPSKPVEATETPGVAAFDAAALDVTGPFARVERAVELQVWSTELSPKYAETLPEGAVVRVGDTRGVCREVVLPFGARGYVHKNFTSELAGDGTVASTATKVSFRYRPQTGEAPVAFVEKGQEFVVVGEEGDWWVVRYPEQRAWVPADALLTFDSTSGADGDATLVGAYTELAKQHHAEGQAFVEGIAAAQAAAARASEHATKLEALRGMFAEERSKPVAEQSYDAVRAALDAFVATLAEDDDAQRIAAGLREQIETQKMIVEATQFVEDEPPPAEIDVASIKPVADPLAGFDAIGWLEVRKPLTGEAQIALVKGGQVLHWLTCTTGRYDLRMFDGLEVGMNGPRNRPNWQSIRTLDVERIEVLRARMK